MRDYIQPKLFQIIDNNMKVLLLLCYLLLGICTGVPAAQPPAKLNEPQAVKPPSAKGNTPPQAVQPLHKVDPIKTDEFPMAQDCDPLKCATPHCRCSATTLTSSLPIEKTQRCYSQRCGARPTN